MSEANRETILKEAIADWERDELLTSAQAAALLRTVEQPQTERQQLARYFFIIAISCSVLAFATLFLSEKLLERFRRFFSIPDGWLALMLLALSAACFWWVTRQQKVATKGMQNAGLIPGVLAALGGLVYGLRSLNLDPSQPLVLGLAAIIFGGLAGYFKSVLLWIGALVSAMGWYAFFAEVHSSAGLFLGMNYPLRFTVFGLLLAGLAAALSRHPRTLFARNPTWHFAAIVFFTGFWGISIFGNYRTMESWNAVKQTSVLVYGILFAISAGAVLWYGIKKEIPQARDYGILFLLINLYTRYFEFFWDAPLNKGVFFLILALSFFLLGKLLLRVRR